jgi:hypothetical protein
MWKRAGNTIKAHFRCWDSAGGVAVSTLFIPFGGFGGVIE